MIKSKICSKCHIRKNIIEFFKDKSHKDSHYPSCKSCCKKYHKKFYKKNKEILLEQTKIYQERNKKKILQYAKKYYEANKKKHREYMKKYNKKHKNKLRKYKREYDNNRRKKDMNFRLIDNLRSRLTDALKRSSKSNKTIKLIGCTIPELKSHLQKQFSKDMNWDNYGLYGWHIDHIKPCYKFNLSKPKEQKECFNYINLRPLWAKENLRRTKNV